MAPKTPATVPEAVSPPAALERRPEATAFRIEDIMRDLAEGRVRIPPFQRGLKWGADDALSLLDSLYRGYPAGTLLFWKRAAPLQSVRLGTLSVAASARPDALWVVDGQQRLTWLAMALIVGTGTDGAQFYFDLDERRFRKSAAGTELPESGIPLKVLMNSEELVEWILGKGERFAFRKDAVLLGKRLREYEIPAYVVEAEEEGILREIFARLNSTGKRLDQFEVFDALYGAQQDQRPASLSGIASDLQGLGFGRVEEKVLQKALFAIQGWDVARRVRKRLHPSEASAAYRATGDALARAVESLQRDAGIPRVDLLPYKIPVVTLARFFHQHPNPRPRSRELLARWIWRGAASERHQGNTAATRKSLEAISADEEGSVQALLAMVGREDPGFDALQPFNFRHARGKIVCLALLALGPRHLRTGEPLTLEHIFDQEDGAEGARSEGRELPRAVASGSHPLRRTAANVMLHPRDPRGLRALIRNAPQAVLASHGVDDKAHWALTRGDISQFLTRRAETVSAQVARYLGSRTRWEETDRKSLESLVVSDD